MYLVVENEIQINEDWNLNIFALYEYGAGK